MICSYLVFQHLSNDLINDLIQVKVILINFNNHLF